LNAPDAIADRVDAVHARALGPTDYETTWRAMQAFTDARNAATSDEIWLTEHPPIYTLGLAGRREHLLRDNGIPVLKVDRGGQVTYHGPGQLIAYLLIDIARRGLGVRSGQIHRSPRFPSDEHRSAVDFRPSRGGPWSQGSAGRSASSRRGCGLATPSDLRFGGLRWRARPIAASKKPAAASSRPPLAMTW